MDKKTFQDLANRRKLDLDFRELEKITDKWGFIRQAYMENMYYIMQQAEEYKYNGIEPYFFDWSQHFSPIEAEAWRSIRTLGRIVLYPQFPLFNYFIDFANPYLRIGLEMDGKQYHDKEKDLERDQKLADFGWKIYRVEGRECHIDFRDYWEVLQDDELDEDEKFDEIENWLMNTCDGVVNSLKMIYFEQHLDEKFYEAALNSLEKHRLATNFNVLD